MIVMFIALLCFAALFIGLGIYRFVDGDWKSLPFFLLLVGALVTGAFLML
jgi:hypothetical protein